MKKLIFRALLICSLPLIPLLVFSIWIFLRDQPLGQCFSEVFKQWVTAFKLGGL